MIEVILVISVVVVLLAIVLGYVYTVKKMSDALESHLRQIDNSTRALMAKDLADYSQSKIVEEMVKEPAAPPDMVPVSDLSDEEFKKMINDSQ